jgi:hypothetical protein
MRWVIIRSRYSFARDILFPGFGVEVEGGHDVGIESTARRITFLDILDLPNLLDEMRFVELYFLFSYKAQVSASIALLHTCFTQSHSGGMDDSAF